MRKSLREDGQDVLTDWMWGYVSTGLKKKNEPKVKPGYLKKKNK